MSSECVNCGEIAEVSRGDDGHFRKKCDSCGHVGGPYITNQREQHSSGQISLDDFR